jgi:DNA-binding XRE family transcriptional regulator
MGFTMSNAAAVQTIDLDGKSFVILPEADYKRLLRAGRSFDLPQADPSGNYPAVEAMRAVIAGGILQDRQKLGWSQAELARRAGIRVETLNRIETGKHTPSVATMQKIGAALQESEKRGRKRGAKRKT